MAELPTGTVAFLVTDVEGSTRRWEAHPTAMRAAMARHDELDDRAGPPRAGRAPRRVRAAQATTTRAGRAGLTC